MKHPIKFFRFLFTFLLLYHGIVITHEYQHPYVVINFQQQTSNISNIAFTARPTLRVNTNNHYKNYYPTPEQLAIVMSWMQKLYPDNITATTPPQKKPSPQQQNQSIPATIATPVENITQQKCDATHITELEDQFFIYQQCPEWDKHTRVIDERTNALKQLKNGNQAHTAQRYALSEKMQRYCNDHSINTSSLEQCEGDILQQTIHNEFVTITKKSANIWHKNKSPKAFKQVTSIIADFTDAGIACNHAHETRKALALADACWMILDCIQAAGEGLLEGAYHTVDDIIHPVRTVQNIAESIAICGYYIGKVAIEIGELSYLVVAEPADKTYQKLKEWADTFAVIYDGIKEKSSTLKTRDVIKETVSLGTQFYTTPKALHGIGKLFKYAHKNAIKLAENVSRSAKAHALTTPEGIVVRIADSTVEFMKNEFNFSSSKLPTVPNMAEFFKLPFGQKLVDKSQRTPYTYQKNIIYKLTENIPGTTLRKKHFYYLDRLHGDHLEIFNSRFEFIGVYNLDGTFNISKYNAARKSGRNIRDIMKGRQ